MKSISITHPKGNNSRLTAPLVRWSLAIILICGFGLLAALPDVTGARGSVGESSFDANPDIKLLAHSETLIVTQRIHATGKDQPGDNETRHHWQALINDENSHYPILDSRRQLRASAALPPAQIPGLQQLNAPRAPPLA